MRLSRRVNFTVSVKIIYLGANFLPRTTPYFSISHHFTHLSLFNCVHQLTKIMAVAKRFRSIQTALVGSNDHAEAIASLKSPNDAIALLVHAWAVEQGLNLLAIGGKDVSAEKSKPCNND